MAINPLSQTGLKRFGGVLIISDGEGVCVYIRIISYKSGRGIRNEASSLSPKMTAARDRRGIFFFFVQRNFPLQAMMTNWPIRIIHAQRAE